MDIVLLIITFIAVCISCYCVHKKSTIDQQIVLENKSLLDTNKELKKQQETFIAENQQLGIDNLRLKADNSELQNTCNQLEISNAGLKERNSALSAEYKREEERLSSFQESIQETLTRQEKLSQEAFLNYCNILTNTYQEKEDEYNEHIEILKKSYEDLQLDLLGQIKDISNDLDNIKKTRQATIEALLREKELENNITYYCINISDSDKSDIAKLETLKTSLNKPRVLSMLIWSTWFQKPLKALANTIVGLNDKTGIYKITNIKTKECYIGQAVNLYWPVKNFSRLLAGVAESG